MSYRVVWHPDALAEAEVVNPPSEGTAIDNAIAKLEAMGSALRHPHSSMVMGSSPDGLRELRPRAGRSR